MAKTADQIRAEISGIRWTTTPKGIKAPIMGGCLSDMFEFQLNWSYPKETSDSRYADKDSIERLERELNDYYTKGQVNSLMSELPKFSISVVDELPTTEISNTTVYLLRSDSSSETMNMYTEYIYVNGEWEELGTQSVDLSEYARVAWVESVLDEYAKKSDIPSPVTEDVVYNWGFTKNAGTITEVKFNGTSLATSGSVDLYAAVNKRINGGTDLNTLLEPGFYHCASSHNCINAHSTVNPFGLVVVHSALGDYYAQFIFDYWGKIYHRFKGGQNNTWSAWTERTVVTDSTVSGWGYTKNAGTITEVKFNGTSLATSGSVNITAPVSKQLTSGSLNSVTDPGIYFAGGGNACTNVATTAGNAFGLIVAKTAGSNYYQQTFYDYFGNEYKRFCKGGVWSAWVRQANANKSMVVNYEDGTSETFNLMVIQ